MICWDELKKYFIDDQGLYLAIQSSFERLYNNDSYLICNTPAKLEDREQLGSHHVGERAIVFRFALYLQNELLKIKDYALYNLDCEYNRNLCDVKTLPSFPNGVYPDLIVHKRGSNDGNLLVIEFKTHWNKGQQAIASDRKKVFQLMQKPYEYNYGLVVIIGKTKEESKIINVIKEKEEFA